MEFQVVQSCQSLVLLVLFFPFFHLEWQPGEFTAAIEKIMPGVGFQMLNVLSDILHQAAKSFSVRVFLIVKQVPATGKWLTL